MRTKFVVGKRYIVEEDRPLNAPIEVKVLEISPSGKRVKFLYPSGAERWELISEYNIIEELIGESKSVEAKDAGFN